MLLETIKKDQVQARKDRNTVVANLLTTLIGEATAIGKNNGNRETTDAEVCALMKKFIKGIDEVEAVKGVTDVTTTERNTLLKYLPTQLSEAELTTVIETIIATNGFTNIGDVLKSLKASYPDQYDGKTASMIVKNTFSN